MGRHSASSSRSRSRSRKRYHSKKQKRSRSRSHKKQKRSRTPSSSKGREIRKRSITPEQRKRTYSPIRRKPQYQQQPSQNQWFNTSEPEKITYRTDPFKKKFLTNELLPVRSSEEVKQFREKHNIYIRSSHSNVLNPLFDFNECKAFPTSVLEEIRKTGFPGPTPIQSQSFSVVLSGSDLIGIAQTGSGKTLAFLLPSLVHIKAQPQLTYGDGPIALILAPTRELTLQIMTQFSKFSEGTGLNAACLYGGQEKYIQKQQLRRIPEIIIACPGRLIDFLEEGATTMKRVTYLVLDEADRMLDMGFEPQIRKIVRQIRPDRQTLLFSATWPKDVQKLALDFCQENPIHIQIGHYDLTSNMSIKQIIYVVKSAEKMMKLNAVLRDCGSHTKILIFCATKKGCESLFRTLDREGIRCLAIHGNKSQNERDYTMHQFREGKIRIMIATDVASRGLDVKDVHFVINFDMPKNIEDYIHRIGRTGRAGQNGTAITFFSSDEDFRLARDLIKILHDAQTPIPTELHDLASQSSGRPKMQNFKYKRYDNNTTTGSSNNGFNPSSNYQRSSYQNGSSTSDFNFSYNYSSAPKPNNYNSQSSSYNYTGSSFTAQPSYQAPQPAVPANSTFPQPTAYNPPQYSIMPPTNSFPTPSSFMPLMSQPLLNAPTQTSTHGPPNPQPAPQPFFWNSYIDPKK